MTLKEVFNISKNELQDIIENKNPDFRLEEAAFNQDEKIWDIVVSYLVEKKV